MRGVLHLSANVLQGLRGLCRVTKVGGMCSLLNTYGAGGLVRGIITFFRENYNRDYSFKSTIDNLNATTLQQGLLDIFSNMDKHGDSFGREIPVKLVEELVDDDPVVTI